MAFTDIRPTVRRRVSRITSYAVFVVIIILLVVFGDWGLIAQNFLNWGIAQQLLPWPGIFRSAINTIVYTLISFLIGLVLATVLALMKMSKGPFKWFAVAYIELFRGMPALLTILLMAFALPIAFRGLSNVFPFGSLGLGLLGLVFVTSAYTAEIIRAGVEAVSKGQREAARSLGMTHMQTMLSVILPQAFRIVIPPLTNEFVTLLKDTSLLYIVGVTLQTKELTQFGKDAVSTFGNSTSLIAVAIVYLIITIPLTYLVSRLEKKMAVKK